MPGIVVGVDGSHHSTQALEWALKEGARQDAPVTPLTQAGLAAAQARTGTSAISKILLKAKAWWLPPARSRERLNQVN